MHTASKYPFDVSGHLQRLLSFHSHDFCKSRRAFSHELKVDFSEDPHEELGDAVEHHCMKNNYVIRGFDKLADGFQNMSNTIVFTVSRIRAADV